MLYNRGEIKFMKKLFPLLIGAILICAVFTGCFGGTNTSTFEGVLKATNAVSGELNSSYFYDTSKIGADGVNPVVDGLSIQNVSKHDTYETENQTLNNVIVFDVTGDFSSLKDYMSNKSTIQTYDTSGKSETNYSSAVYANGDKTYLLFYSPDSVKDVKFVVLGGFNSNKNNGNSKFAFEI